MREPSGTPAPPSTYVRASLFSSSSPGCTSLTSHIQFRIRKKVLCDHCRGTGAASTHDIHACPGCGGSGVKVVKQQIFPGMFAQSQQTCDQCGGRGKVIAKACEHCGGAKVLDQVAGLELEVLEGMPEGHEVVFEAEGDESPDWSLEM